MPEYIKTDGSVRFSAGYTPATQQDAATKAYVDAAIASASPGARAPVPAAWDDTVVIPDGVVGQRTEWILPLQGTPPFFVICVQAGGIESAIQLTQLDGGSWKFVCVPPNEGNTGDVTKDLVFNFWNAHPDTNFESPLSQTVSWLIKPTAQNASWGTPGNLPDAEVGVLYEWKPTTIGGTGPYGFARTAGLTTANLNAAGLTILSGTTPFPDQTAVIYGTPVPGSENTLGSSITLGVTGQTGVQATNAFTNGIVIRRKPALTLQAIPTITTGSGSLDLSQYLVGYPVTSITLDSSSTALPSGVSLGSNTLTWTGLTSASNGATTCVFKLSNGYHTDTTVTRVININVPSSGSISYDTFTRFNRTGTADPQTVSHAGGANVKGVFLIAENVSSNTDHAASASAYTYGGVVVPRVLAVTGSNRHLAVHFLGSGVLTGTQTASFDFDSATTDDFELLVITVNASGALEVVDFGSLGGSGSNSGDTMAVGGALSQTYSVARITLPNASDVVANANMSPILELDAGVSQWVAHYQTTPGTADFTASYTHSAATREFGCVALRLATGGGAPGALDSWAKGGNANAASFASLADNTEITTLSDLVSGATTFTSADGTSAAHEGPRKVSASNALLFSDTGPVSSVGYNVPSLSPPFWFGLHLAMDASSTGVDGIVTTGAASLLFEKDAGGGGLDQFRYISGALAVDSPAIDALGNAVSVLVYVVDANTAGIALGVGGSVVDDSGNVTQTGIGVAMTKLLFNFSPAAGNGRAKFLLQAVARGSGAPNKAAVVSWLYNNSSVIIPPPPPPTGGITKSWAGWSEATGRASQYNPFLTYAAHIDDLVWVNGYSTSPNLHNTRFNEPDSEVLGHRLDIYTVNRKVDKQVPHLGTTRKAFESTLWNTQPIYLSNNSIRAHLKRLSYKPYTWGEAFWLGCRFQLDASVYAAQGLSGLDFTIGGVHEAPSDVPTTNLTAFSHYIDPVAGGVRWSVQLRGHAAAEPNPGDTDYTTLITKQAGPVMNDQHVYDLVLRIQPHPRTSGNSNFQVWLAVDDVLQNNGNPIFETTSRWSYAYTPPGQSTGTGRWDFRCPQTGFYAWRGTGQFTPLSADNISGIPPGSKGIRLYTHKAFICPNGTFGGVTTTLDEWLAYLRLVE